MKIMIKTKNYLKFSVLIVLGLFILSCDRDEIKNSTINPVEKDEAQVTIDLAKQVALNFMKYEISEDNSNKENSNLSARKSANATTHDIKEFKGRKINQTISIPDKNGDNAMHVLTFSPKGYIIVSATKKQSPILAFSTEFNLDLNNPSRGLKKWINSGVSNIQALKEIKDFKIPVNIKKLWEYLSAGMLLGNQVYDRVKNMGNHQSGPLLKTLWGQGVGYNNLINDGDLQCADYANGNAPTGCVATAVAQVMRYNEYPPRYNWGIMPKEIFGWEGETPGVTEVAKLMRDVGNNVNMQYGCKGSGAWPKDARNALVNVFGYSNSAQLVNYNFDTLTKEIDANRPVVMSGQDKKEGGHAWVCDGWKIFHWFKFVHMNWGWNGVAMRKKNNNGWFLCDNFKINGIDMNFDNSDIMIIGIKKP